VSNLSVATKIIQPGNSKGLRLRKTIVENYDIGDAVHLRMEENFSSGFHGLKKKSKI